MLTDPGLRQIALWKLEGYTNPEIAERLECTLRTVERKLDRAYWEAVKLETGEVPVDPDGQSGPTGEFAAALSSNGPRAVPR